ncbi:hypothetical protein, partial [Streptomyces ureilyticus]
GSEMCIRDSPTPDRSEPPRVCCCSRFSRRSRSSSSRSALLNSPGVPSPRSAFALPYQPRKDSELMPSSRATAVTVLPEESTSATASRSNSSDYRSEYLLPTRGHSL